MLTIRRDKEIHREEGGWFTARWHFSFDHYRDPANDGFGAMRVFKQACRRGYRTGAARP
jgi:redox-sensitive bicupin YhaK (pirin superfamily)